MLVLLALSLVSAVYGAQICCPDLGCFNDDPPFNHLPLPQCKNVVQPNFNLYTRSNPSNAVQITRGNIPSQFSNSRRTMFLIHGWNNDRTSPWLHTAKNALLNQGDYNAIIVGWGGGANDLDYGQSASNTRVAGAEAADIAAMLVNNGLSRSNLYCIGHSLGGHTCGFAGKRYKFGRITGLDPAGPLFEESATAAHLWHTDADFVDVLHTQMTGDGLVELGIMKAVGHVDHYPNGGGIQPGCQAVGPKDPGEPGQVTYVCSHGRAYEYFTESVTNDCFLARQQCTNPANLPGSCSSCGGVCQSMGFHSEQYGGRGLFYMTTNPSSPYCQN